MGRTFPVLAMCWLVVMFDGMDLNLYGAVMPHMMADKELGLTPSTAGTIGSWTTLGMLIGALAAGNLTDWAGRRPVVISCTVVFSAGSVLCAVSQGTGAFGFGRFIAGLGLGGVLPTCLAMVMEFAPAGRAAWTAGALMTSYHVGGMLATGLGLSLTSGADWRWVFWAGVVPAFVAVPLLLRHLPESPSVLLARGKREQADEVARRFGMERPAIDSAPAWGVRGRWDTVLLLFRASSRWATLLLWAASFCGLLLVYGVSTWLPQLMRAAGYGVSSSVSFLLVINAGGIAGMFLAGRAATRFGPVRVCSLWFVLTAAGSLLLSVRMPLMATYAVVALTGVWLFSAQVMVYAAVSALYPAGRRAAGLGWTTGVGRLGAVVGPMLGGAVMANGAHQWGFAAFAVAGLIGALTIAAVPLASGTRARGPDAEAPHQPELSAPPAATHRAR
ncbi:MFS transporter [Streptomyces sp. NPDC002889]|uniref:MFS transporter n=1 Tax=Streptomyces sp. NPDC002889 TaxID=3364669 RepID=UPI003697121C